ncbi:MAG TPA: VacB/RNase II family 3'-5' exoribonuclease [Terriglobales bacterium]|nr:VacB/RNase II family 3'-5' exoribonuclease [Terriglobales bacterium]
MLSDAEILRKIERQPRQSAGYKQLVRELRIKGDGRQELKERLADLVRRGKLIADAEKFMIPVSKPSKNQIFGRLTMHRDGYGFVIPESEEVRTRITGDIYVGPHGIDNAMHGDRVLVEIGPVRPDGRAEGRIVRVVGRAHPTVVGIFHYGRKFNYVRPIDEKLTQDIMIPPEMEYPEEEEDSSAVRTSAQKGDLERHRVVGSEAKRTVNWDDLENVVVDVEITQWPTQTQPPKGRVVEILGYEDDFGVDVEIVIRKHHLPHRFPAEVLEEAQAFSPVIRANDLKTRVDYRDLPIVTIDGETARDFDDAVLVTRLENGNFELQVHIADVAQYVTDGSAIDREARLRGTSVYFPDRAIPMLPIELSTDLCSLRPKVDRLVLSCTMEIDPHGEVLAYQVNQGVIRSAERMTYTAVNAVLEGDEKLRERYAPLVEKFELMKELAMILNRKRQKRGSIDFDLPEAVIEFDEQGLMQGITRSERNIAHRLIEEFMLAANESVASYLENKNVPSLYRIHEKPDPKRVFDFENVAAAFGYSLGIGALPVKRMTMKAERRDKRHTGREPRLFEIPEEVHITPRMYQKLTQKIAGSPMERILSYLMLRSLKQARYSEENVGHFALATGTYTHFTSPIRRYPDLIVHRILKQVLMESAEEWDDGIPIGIGKASTKKGAWERSAQAEEESRRDRLGRGKSVKREEAQNGPIPLDVLHDIAEETSETERHAADAERELLEWKKIKFMQDHVGEEFAGLVISVTKFGFFVELADLFIEGLVPLSSLIDDRYIFNDRTKQIIGQRTHKQYSLGDQVRVMVDRIDPVLHKINFMVVTDEPQKRPRKGQRRKSFL